MSDSEVQNYALGALAVGGALGAIGLTMYLLAKKSDTRIDEHPFYKDENPTREFQPPNIGKPMPEHVKAQIRAMGLEPSERPTMEIRSDGYIPEMGVYVDTKKLIPIKKPPFIGAVFLTRTEERILADAITKAGAASYLHEDVVLDLLARGLVERRGDHKVVATEAGRRAFLRQD
jgi:hypothetical protein